MDESTKNNRIKDEETWMNAKTELKTCFTRLRSNRIPVSFNSEYVRSRYQKSFSIFLLLKDFNWNPKFLESNPQKSKPPAANVLKIR